ncbi:hypothetical protein ABIB90_007084 [Bradyrhizobium sp. JR4.1]
MIAFIDDHRGAHGVEPICKVLPIAPSTYHAHVAKRRDPAKLSARARQDAALKIEVRRVFDENFSVYGARKVWRQLKREGFDVARSTVSRLMQDMGLQGVIRGKPVKTTISDKAAPCPLDHVNRQFNEVRDDEGESGEQPVLPNMDREMVDVSAKQLIWAVENKRARWIGNKLVKIWDGHAWVGPEERFGEVRHRASDKADTGSWDAEMPDAQGELARALDTETLRGQLRHKV